MAYAVTKPGARIFLDHCRVVRRPIDDEMDRTWAHGQRNLSVFPFPVLGELGESIIGVSRFQTFVVPRELRFKRLVARCLELRRLDTWAVMHRFQQFRAGLMTRTRSNRHSAYPDHSVCEIERWEEVDGTAVVSRGDTPEVFELVEEALDAIAELVCAGGVRDGDGAASG